MNHVCTGAAPNKSCQIKYWGCWNEPNLDGFWGGDYEQSAKMCSDMVSTVKGQCQSCLTITPEFAASGGGYTKRRGESSYYAEWASKFLQAYSRYGNYPDIAGFHAYASRPNGVIPVPFPETFAGSGCRGGGGGADCPQTLPDKISTLRAVFDRYGMAGRPMWNTEGGWTRNAQLEDPDAQAAFLARWYIVQASAGVARAFWYMWDMGGNPNAWGGLWDPNNAVVNKAGIAYGHVYNWLVGATFTKPCTGQGTVWTCDLSRPGGYQARIVWDTSRSHNTRVTSNYSVGPEFTQSRDLEGRVVKITGGASVAIGSKPTLFETGSPRL